VKNLNTHKATEHKMSETNVTLAIMTQGWQSYQNRVSEALAPLSLEQLALCAAPNLRSINELACHIIAVRADWFHEVLNVGGEDFNAFSQWDLPDSPPRPASELVSGLEATWQVMQEALARFTPADLEENIQAEHRGQTYTFTRGWVVWHVIEHDLHHGGELAYTLGMYGLKAPNI
jgi:uncharacterized damage-inducible protein DinB